MAIIRKRQWTTRNGETKEAYLVDYTDQLGERRGKHFRLKKDAEEYLTIVRHEVKEGTHTPPGRSITVREAAENWLIHVEREGRERSTWMQYRQHVTKHINPRIGNSN